MHGTFNALVNFQLSIRLNGLFLKLLSLILFDGVVFSIQCAETNLVLVCHKLLDKPLDL